MIDIHVEQRIRALEKATALAYLDALDNPSRAVPLANRVLRAEAEGKHYRLVRRVGDEEGHFYADIEVED